jgi:hypothetical protein
LEKNLSEWNINDSISKARAQISDSPDTREEPPWFTQLDTRLFDASEGSMVLFVDKTAPEQTLLLQKKDNGDSEWPNADWQVADASGISLTIQRHGEEPPNTTFIFSGDDTESK